MSHSEPNGHKHGHQLVLLTKTQAAEMLSLTPRALQNWRFRGEGPVFYKISGRAVRYRIEDIEQWLAQKIRRSTSDSGPSNPAGSSNP